MLQELGFWEAKKRIETGRFGPRTEKKENCPPRPLQREAHTCMTKGQAGWGLEGVGGLTPGVGKSQ